jgi:hypothetical protein
LPKASIVCPQLSSYSLVSILDWSGGNNENEINGRIKQEAIKQIIDEGHALVDVSKQLVIAKGVSYTS